MPEMLEELPPITAAEVIPDLLADELLGFISESANGIVKHLLNEGHISLKEIRERVVNVVFNYELQRRNLNSDFFYCSELTEILRQEIQRQQTLFLQAQESHTFPWSFSNVSLQDRINSEIAFITNAMQEFQPEIPQRSQSTWFDRMGLAAEEFFRKFKRMFRRKNQ